ncbi:acyltransferase family protein [Fibrella forsythiae]|uniref:Acyltransferase n=1 Tax=Fibrella forsythiae TaxID=2817061 RepID=A0ABS3JFG5_9BACT|nr:acyltransferase [Fibrella forsythiae]MBO0948727.1 acyltransferase [Fibrella forsythiae]
MGLLKVLLAAMVVFVHAGQLPGFPTMGGSIAVQAFYIISGFYMALILNEKYVDQPHAYRLFLTNRVLRLLPIYYVVVGLTLLVALVMTITLGEPRMEFFQAIRTNGNRLAPSTSALLLITNLTLVGQDWLSFLTVSPATGTLVFTGDFSHAWINLNSFLVAHPSWTVGLELTFYLIAPLLVRRPLWVMVLVMTLSIAIRAALRYFAHLDSMAWTYRFFPAELLYFLAGGLAYKAYRHLKNRTLPGWLCPAAIAIALLYTAFFGLIHQQLTQQGVPGGLSSAVYRLVITATLPLVFIGSKHNKFDASIGELSYPLYLVHFLVWETLGAWHIGGAYINLYTLVIATGLAYGINQLVGQPIEQLRQRIFNKNSPKKPVASRRMVV